MNIYLVLALPISCAILTTGCVPLTEALAPTSTSIPTITPSPTANYGELHIGTSKVYRVKADGSDLQEIALGTRPAFSGNGRYLSYVQGDDDRDNLMLYEPNNGSTQTISLKGHLRDYEWSPDGRYIAAIAMWDEVGTLLIYDPLMGKSVEIALTQPLDYLSWSPDAKSLVWVYDSLLRVYDTETQKVSTLLDWDGGICLPAWSPHSDQLVIAAADGAACTPNVSADFIPQHEEQLYRINADGSDLTRLTDVEGSVFDIQWSPVASQIAYLERGMDGRDRLHLIDADGLEQDALDANGTFRMRWSPDGKQIALGGPIGIYDVESKAKLFGNGAAYWPDEWSPDGTMLLASRNCCGLRGFSVIDLSQLDKPRSVTHDLTAERIFSTENPVWSPDGEWIAFSAFEGCRCP